MFRDGLSIVVANDCLTVPGRVLCRIYSFFSATLVDNLNLNGPKTRYFSFARLLRTEGSRCF
jgi:hypothetical protein